MKKLILILFLLLSSSVFCQPIKWQRIYTGPHSPGQDLSGNDIMFSDNGNFFILSSYSQSTGNQLIKINQFGDTLFKKFYPLEQSYSGLATQGGSFYTVGSGGYDTSLYGHMFSSLFNSNGDTIKRNTYYKIENRINKLIKSSDNNLIACGNKITSALIVKIDTNFNLIWEKSFSASWSKVFNSITESQNLNFIAVGYGFDMGSEKGYGLLTKINSSGDSIWEKKYTLFSYGFNATSINKLYDDKYLVFISAWDSALNESKLGFLKIDEDGNIVYRKIFYELPKFTFHGYDCKILNNNRYIFCFDCDRYPQNDTSLANVMITDSLGNIIKRKEYTGTDYTRFYRINAINDNDYLFIGESDHLSRYDACIYAVRTDSSLEVPALPIGIENISSNVVNNFELFQNYPNPFNPLTIISFQIKEKGLVKIIIYDILGKEIETLVNDNFYPSTNKIKFDGSNLPSGVYFYRLILNNKSITRKMLLLK